MARVYAILSEESIRSGMPSDTATKHLNPDGARLIVRQRAESNPTLFIEDDCRGSADVGFREFLQSIQDARRPQKDRRLAMMTAERVTVAR